MRYLIAVLLALPGVAMAADTIPGPIVAAVVRVYDGDTMTVNAYPDALLLWRPRDRNATELAR